MRGFVKWFLIPAALMAFGYFFVGPRFGGKVAEKVEAQVPVAEPQRELPKGPPPSSSPAEPPRKSRSFAPPEVETSVETPPNDRPRSEAARPRRDRGEAKTKPATPEESPADKPDEGGSGGALGGG